LLNVGLRSRLLQRVPHCSLPPNSNRTTNFIHCHSRDYGTLRIFAPEPARFLSHLFHSRSFKLAITVYDSQIIVSNLVCLLHGSDGAWSIHLWRPSRGHSRS
jgi:hypothetical protein